MQPSPLSNVQQRVKQILFTDSTGHDYFHAKRVAELAHKIAIEEGADLFICELAGWTHDLCRPYEKEYGVPHWGPEALKRIEELLRLSGVNKPIIQQVLVCIAEHESYDFLGQKPSTSLESRILQDADRLDAIGAIGIARAFMFAGAHDHILYIPGGANGEWSPTQQSKTAIGHFYEKLFKLADGMHTATGKRIASERKEFMEDYLERFFNEWKGEA